MNHPFTIAVDFDGVLADYSAGWRGWNQFGIPIRGAADAMRELAQMGCHLAIWTTRQDTPKLRDWLSTAGITYHSLNSTEHNPPHTSNKPIFSLILDDKAYPRCGQQFNRNDWDAVVITVRHMIANEEGEL